MELHRNAIQASCRVPGVGRRWLCRLRKRGELLLFVYFPVASIWMDLFSELTTG